jgi:hypothetical protein
MNHWNRNRRTFQKLMTDRTEVGVRVLCDWCQDHAPEKL